MSGREFLFGRLDHVAGQPDRVEVGIRLREPVEQVERAVHDVVGVVAPVEKEPLGGLVQLRQARLTTGRCRPGQEAFRVHARVEPAAGKQQPEVVAQAVGGYAGVHQDRPDEVERQFGERRHPQAGDRRVERAPPDPLVLWRALEAGSLPQRGPVGSALVICRCHSGHRGCQAGWPARAGTTPPRSEGLPGSHRADRGQLRPGGCRSGRRSASATRDAPLSRGPHESSRNRSSSRMLTLRGEAGTVLGDSSGLTGANAVADRMAADLAHEAAGTCSARRCRTRRGGPGPGCRPRTGRSVPAAGPGRARRDPRSSGVTAAGSGTSPCSTPMTATAWNSRPFIACMVPARTPCVPPRPLSGVVVMPSAFSISRASRTRLADRAVTPMACGSMPIASHERICSAS